MRGARRLRLARFALPLLLTLGGCMHHVIHQGNVLKPALVDAIQEGDSRFHVESVLGSPVLNDVLHPNRAVYVEWYKNPETGQSFKRRVIIYYDRSERVDRIERVGFDDAHSAD
jgi:outer membrane protein assembly factor BamE (lipoprotein component of BamABCDE complex)